MQSYESPAHPLQKWQEAVWLLIVLLTPLFVNLWVEQLFEASKVWLLRTLIWLLAVLCLAGWLAGAKLKPLPPRIGKLIVALSLVLLLSTLLSANHYIAIFGTLDRANGVLTQLSYLLLFVCVATNINASGSRRLLHLLILTAIPICLLGLAQAAGWQPFPLLSDARSLLTTTLGRANFTGAYLALLLPLTLTAAQLAKSTWQRSAYGLLIALELIVIALTQARAAWIAALVGLSVLLWLQVAPRWSRRLRWLSGLGGLAVLAGGLGLILQRGLANGGSIAARFTIWQASLRLIWLRLWLGYGADTLELYFPAVYPPQLVYYQGRGVIVDRAHNWLLDWSLNYGLVATAIFIGLVYLILRAGWKGLTANASSSTPKSLHAGWLAACMAAICAHLAGNLFLFDVAATAMVFWLLLAIVLAATTRYNRQTLQLSWPLWAKNVILITSIVILAGAVWYSNIRPLLADAHVWRGTRALNQENPLLALAEYSAAVNQQPQRAEYYVAVALTAAEVGYFEQADQIMQKALALRPTDPALYTHLAAIYAAEGVESPQKIALAYQAYQQAIALAPTIGLSYQQYADLALRSGDVTMALKLAQQAVDLDATDGTAYGILGWSQLHLGNLNAAQSAFEQAVKWTPNSADFHLGLATAHFQQGNLKAAHQAVQYSLSLNPTYAPTLALQLQLQNK